MPGPVVVGSALSEETKKEGRRKEGKRENEEEQDRAEDERKQAKMVFEFLNTLRHR